MNHIPRILLLGANGQLGFELRRSLASFAKVLACDRRRADFTHPESLRGLVRDIRPNIIVNAAAYTAVDNAESKPELAMTVNAHAPRVLADEAKRVHALLVHFSTDYVFDGSKGQPWVETDRPHPLNLYGASKLAGEQAITEAEGAYLIFRTTWLYCPRGHNFLLTMLRLAEMRSLLRVVHDQVGAPTTAAAVADATNSILKGLVASGLARE